jgi:hypothetical protein
VPANRISRPIIGLLITQNVFGPPGYGENPKTDIKRKIYVLETGLRIQVVGVTVPRQPPEDCQLFFGEEEGPNSWAAAGSASEARVGAEHTQMAPPR